jgi:hypothetical protein
MKLTRSAPAREPRPLQLIPSVRPTVGEEHTEAAPGVTTARGVSSSDGAAAAPHGPGWHGSACSAFVGANVELPGRTFRGGSVGRVGVPRPWAVPSYGRVQRCHRGAAAMPALKVDAARRVTPSMLA